MGKPTGRSRDDDDKVDRDEDADRPAKKKAKKQAKPGGNTMPIVAGIGGVAAVALLCLCGGGGVAGYYFGWFGGGDKKIAKGGDNAATEKDKGKAADKDKGKDADKDKDKSNVKLGPPLGTGPQVNDVNFGKAARQGKSLADVEKIMGPGLPLKGAAAEKAKIYQVYRSISELRPGADAYQWSNDRDVYFIFFRDGMWSASGGEAKK